MFGNSVEFERFDMRQWPRFSKTGNCIQRGMRTGTNDHVLTAQLTGGPVRKSGLYCSWSYEPPGSENELRSRFPVIV